MQNLQYEYLDSRYENLTILGNQDKKATYLAKGTVDGQIVVKKYIQKENADIYKRLQEMDERHLVKVYYVAESGQQALVIMEYVSGQTIEQMQKAGWIFSEQEVIIDTIQLLKGIATIHAQGIIHRDISPKNVLISTDGVVKLLDFDIGRKYKKSQGSDTTILGTVGYAAPEQFGFGQTDARTDIYAMGVLLNYMLVREFPMEKLTEGKFRTIVLKCIKINPEDRYQNVDELKADICNAAEIPCSSMDSDKNKFYCAQSCKKDQAGEIPFYKIPGFRTGKVWKMIVAVIGYALTTVTAWSLEAHDANGKLLPQSKLTLERLVVWLSQIVFIFFVCDYMGMRRNIPVVNSKNQFVRLLGYVAAEFIFLFAAAAICAILEAILF